MGTWYMGSAYREAVECWGDRWRVWVDWALLPGCVEDNFSWATVACRNPFGVGMDGCSLQRRPACPSLYGSTVSPGDQGCYGNRFQKTFFGPQPHALSASR